MRSFFSAQANPSGDCYSVSSCGEWKRCCEDYCMLIAFKMPSWRDGIRTWNETWGGNRRCLYKTRSTYLLSKVVSGHRKDESQRSLSFQSRHLGVKRIHCAACFTTPGLYNRGISVLWGNRAPSELISYPSLLLPYVMEDDFISWQWRSRGILIFDRTIQSREALDKKRFRTGLFDVCWW
jgi:hypothetical protein